MMLLVLCDTPRLLVACPVAISSAGGSYPRESPHAMPRSARSPPVMCPTLLPLRRSGDRPKDSLNRALGQWMVLAPRQRRLRSDPTCPGSVMMARSVLKGGGGVRHGAAGVARDRIVPIYVDIPSPCDQLVRSTGHNGQSGQSSRKLQSPCPSQDRRNQQGSRADKAIDYRDSGVHDEDRNRCLRVAMCAREWPCVCP